MCNPRTNGFIFEIIEIINKNSISITKSGCQFRKSDGSLNCWIYIANQINQLQFHIIEATIS